MRQVVGEADYEPTVSRLHTMLVGRVGADFH